jgi:hypothetical protein
MKRWRVFVPTITLFVLALWPFAVFPMTRLSTYWAFYLSVPLTVAAFVALAAGVAMFLVRGSGRDQQSL